MALTGAELEAQYSAALDKANRIRARRADFKREVKAGVPLKEAIFDPPDWLEEARVRDFVLAIPHVGPRSVDDILRRAGVPAYWRFRQLTPRQRTALTERIAPTERRRPKAAGFVPNDKLREAFIASGLPTSEVARRLGWKKPNGKNGSVSVDGSRLAVALGLRNATEISSNGVRTRVTRRSLMFSNAVAIAEALGLDRDEMGL